MNCRSDYAKIIDCLRNWDEGDESIKNLHREVFMEECVKHVIKKYNNNNISMKMIKEVALKEYYAHKE